MLAKFTPSSARTARASRRSSGSSRARSPATRANCASTDGRAPRVAAGGHRGGHRRHPAGAAAGFDPCRGGQHLPRPRAANTVGARRSPGAGAPAAARWPPSAKRWCRRAPSGNLEAGERQLVAIARALSLNARLLIMDEPSSSLGPSRSAGSNSRRDLAARGVAIIYVSHRLDEVARLATRSPCCATAAASRRSPGCEVDEQEWSGSWWGATIERAEIPPCPPRTPRNCCASSTSRCADPRGRAGYRLKDISLTVRRGEIVGLSGLIGAGRSDFLLALTGALDRRPQGRHHPP